MEILNKKVLIVLLRLALGSIFLAYGLDGFFPFLPKTLASDKAVSFISAMIDSGYLWTLLKVGETLGGAMLLLDLYTPLALVLLAPIVVNIVCFHLFLNPAGWAIGIYPIGVTIAILELLLAWCYRKSFQGLFIQRAVAQPIYEKSEEVPELKEEDYC